MVFVGAGIGKDRRSGAKDVLKSNDWRETVFPVTTTAVFEIMPSWLENCPLEQGRDFLELFFQAFGRHRPVGFDSLGKYGDFILFQHPEKVLDGISPGI